MITVKIGTETKNYIDVTESWITEQVNRRRRDGQNVCVEVLVNIGDVNLRLTTPGCGAGGGGGRAPRDREQRIFDLWDKRGLNAPGFTGGSLIAFLKQLRQLLG